MLSNSVLFDMKICFVIWSILLAVLSAYGQGSGVASSKSKQSSGQQDVGNFGDLDLGNLKKINPQFGKPEDINLQDFGNLNELTPQQLEYLKKLTPEQLENLEGQLTPQQKEELKQLIADVQLPSTPANKGAGWVERLQEDGVDWNKIPQDVREHLWHWLEEREKTQRVIDVGNPPYSLPQEGPVQIPGLQYMETKQFIVPQAVLMAADSVGRIEDSSGNLIGTAWVIKDGIVVTNCHVALQLLASGSIPPDIFVDFEPSDTHTGSREFALINALYVSHQKGLDLALLTVSKTSKNSSSNLPPPLPVKGINTFPMTGYFVAYARGTQKSSTFDTALFVQALSNLGKSSRIGSSLDIAALASFGSFGVLLHNASTHY